MSPLDGAWIYLGFGFYKYFTPTGVRGSKTADRKSAQSPGWEFSVVCWRSFRRDIIPDLPKYEPPHVGCYESEFVQPPSGLRNY